MIKYDVKNYEEFFSCIVTTKPIYMEKSISFSEDKPCLQAECHIQKSDDRSYL